jgi:hypothetical protein
VFGDRHELLLDISTFAKAGSNRFDLGEIRLLQGKTMRSERFLRVLDQSLAELRVFDRTADDGTDHLVTHGFSSSIMRQQSSDRQVPGAEVPGAESQVAAPGTRHSAPLLNP